MFLGPPGAGKGTQAQRLSRLLGIAHLSTGELLRETDYAESELGRKAAEYMNAGKLVPDDVVIGLVRDRLKEKDCAPGCLFDGFPRTVPQAEALDRMLAEYRTPLDVVLAFEVEESQLIDRLSHRGRSDDDLEIIRERSRSPRRRGPVCQPSCLRPHFGRVRCRRPRPCGATHRSKGWRYSVGDSAVGTGSPFQRRADQGTRCAWEHSRFQIANLRLRI